MRWKQLGASIGVMLTLAVGLTHPAPAQGMPSVVEHVYGVDPDTRGPKHRRLRAAIRRLDRGAGPKSLFWPYATELARALPREHQEDLYEQTKRAMGNTRDPLARRSAFEEMVAYRVGLLSSHLRPLPLAQNDRMIERLGAAIVAGSDPSLDTEEALLSLASAYAVWAWGLHPRGLAEYYVDFDAHPWRAAEVRALRRRILDSYRASSSTDKAAAVRSALSEGWPGAAAGDCCNRHVRLAAEAAFADLSYAAIAERRRVDLAVLPHYDADAKQPQALIAAAESVQEARIARDAQIADERARLEEAARAERSFQGRFAEGYFEPFSSVVDLWKVGHTNAMTAFSLSDQAVPAAALRAWQDTAHAQQLPRTAEVLAWVEIYVDAQALGAPNGGFGYCVDPQAPPLVPTLHLSYDLVSRSDERRLGEPRRVQVKVGEQRVRVPPPPNPSGLSPEARVERLLEIHGTLSWLDPSASELQTRWDALFIDLIANGSSPSREAAHRRAGDAASYAADWADDLRREASRLLSEHEAWAAWHKQGATYVDEQYEWRTEQDVAEFTAIVADVHAEVRAGSTVLHEVQFRAQRELPRGVTDRDIAREIECLATRRLDVPKVHRDALLLRLDALGPPPATGVEALAMAYAREGEKDGLEALLKAIDAITPRPAVE